MLQRGSDRLRRHHPTHKWQCTKKRVYHGVQIIKLYYNTFINTNVSTGVTVHPPIPKRYLSAFFDVKTSIIDHRKHRQTHGYKQTTTTVIITTVMMMMIIIIIIIMHVLVITITDKGNKQTRRINRVPTVLVKKISRTFPWLFRTPEAFFQDPVLHSTL